MKAVDNTTQTTSRKFDVQRISEENAQFMILSFCKYFRLIIIVPIQLPLNTHLKELRALLKSVKENCRL